MQKMMQSIYINRVKPFSMIRNLATHSIRKTPLLPPLSLYRKILRQHRELPTLQREMGDQYVKNEFKLHKDIDNPLHIVGFLTSWQDYLTMITHGNWKENALSRSTLEKMSDDQVVQLYELMKEAEKLYKNSTDDLDTETTEKGTTTTVEDAMKVGDSTKDSK
ncbi:Sdh7p NDAI_0F04450 [Naumovozyma dairenensis CBS 421]|uniref:Succinate dehydrogenase assembly factor 3 n=1 Tax=Naumovozyma dairenensis (strain ATCC 10597 / BCRC 20456 / CBS 421 / NBRC 0211 / NRRL Y-12639) TaxID=1071378 RepID=G0WDA2_NAUDC|nr:hypothetical protein NDAI_0F04450 [Naumovozyma dairenensis CBS 421]CCD25763.1 hypothetical protein NDAI_0F04450 [Naumovozyma dairenensis CBS 421]